MLSPPYRAYTTIMFGRLLTWTLAGAGINDWLQTGFAALANRSNELERRFSQP
jgi:hypothetical protein